MMVRKALGRTLNYNWRIILIVISVSFMLFILGFMLFFKTELISQGTATLSESNFKEKSTVALNGQWEFYYDKMLTPEDFKDNHPPQMDSYISVPGSWADKKSAPVPYAGKGVGTYRMVLDYPSSLKDPAIRINIVSTAYKLYVDGRCVIEVGKVSKNPKVFKSGAGIHIVELPAGKKGVELIFQVANLEYKKGGLRESPIFGSKQVLTQHRMTLMAMQLIFIGGVLLFGVYYFLNYFLQPKNKTALFFSLLCFITGLRSIIWGEIPIMNFLPNMTHDALAYVNYLTGYNMIPLMVLFIVSIYPSDVRKVSLCLVLLPTLFFECLLLTSTQLMSVFSGYLYFLILAQLVYVLFFMIRMVLKKRENALLLYTAMCVYSVTINQDILHFNALGGIDFNMMFLYGNIAVVIVMAYVQSKMELETHKKLLLFNENLLEADRLKDKIMATELSFLQAQIKPHFLYNALNAIANVCEKDGQKASNLIIDLAVYLRGSLTFNDLDQLNTLDEELVFVDTYFHIEQARFGEKINLIKEIDCPNNVKLPILILQPLVENAVQHAISKKNDGGIVHINIRQTEEGTQFEVRDNGIGMALEVLERLLIDDHSDGSVGLLNIHYRLNRLYGEGLHITSELGTGTVVKFYISNKNSKF